MFRTMRAAWEEELIDENPVARVRVPRMAEVKRARMILTDDEIARYIASPNAKRVDMKVMSLASRTEGGMRTGDLTRWDWTMIDRDGFAECTIPRAKKGLPQQLEIPEVLRPFLRAWWEGHKSPNAGPVFPGLRGRHRGTARADRGTSFAGVLRRELLRAGIVRHDCDGSCSRKDSPTPCPNFASDPLYNDTPTTQRVDFHSFRRAFNTALAEAGVNVQQAMHLAGHSDPKVHAMYVMSTRRMQQIPAAALPQLPAGSATVVTHPDGPANDASVFQRRGSDSNRRVTVLQTVA
jgi:integrase